MDIFLAMILSFLKRLSHLMPQCYEFLLLLLLFFSSLSSLLFTFLNYPKTGPGTKRERESGGGGKEGGETSLEAEAALNGNVGGGGELLALCSQETVRPEEEGTRKL